jgi:hypothetical protein
MPCKTSPQSTLFQIVTRLQLPICDWLAGLSRVSARLHEHGPDDWQNFELVRLEIERSLQTLTHEEELSFQSNSPQALEVLFDHFAEQRGKLAMALAHAGRALGRADLLAQFQPVRDSEI